MSSVDTRSRAADAIARKGQTVTIIGGLSVVYDPATGTVSGGTYNASAKAVLLPLSPYRQANDADVQAGDEQMLLSALDVNGAALAKPPLNATITLADGTTKYTLIAIAPLHPDGTQLLFDCVVRGNA